MRRAALLVSLAALALAATGTAEAASWAQPQIRVVVRSKAMGPSVAKFRPGAPFTRGELAKAMSVVTGTAEDDGAAGPHRPHVGARPRPRQGGRDARLRQAPAGRGARGRARAAGAVRHRGRGAAARPPARPPEREGQPRAAPDRPRHPSRGRLLLREAPPARRLEHPLRPLPRRFLRSADVDRVAEADPRPRRLVRRFPLRLGRDVGADPDPLRRHLPGRLRLLRLRLEDLPPRVLSRRRQAPDRAPGAHNLRTWRARCRSRRASSARG